MIHIFRVIAGNPSRPTEVHFQTKCAISFSVLGQKKVEPENLYRRNKRQHEEPPQPHCDLIQAFVEKLLAITAPLWAMRGPGDTRVEGLVSEMSSVTQGTDNWKIQCFSDPQPHELSSWGHYFLTPPPSLVSYQASFGCGENLKTPHIETWAANRKVQLHRWMFWTINLCVMFGKQIKAETWGKISAFLWFLNQQMKP